MVHTKFVECPVVERTPCHWLDFRHVSLVELFKEANSPLRQHLLCLCGFSTCFNQLVKVMSKSNSNLHLPTLSNGVSWEQIDVSQTSPCLFNLACPGLSFRGLVNWRRVDFGHVRRVLKWSGNAIFWSSSIVLYVVSGWNWLKHLQSTASKFWNFLECSRTTKKIQRGWRPLIHLKPLTSYCKASALDWTAEFSITCPTLHMWKGKITRNIRLPQVSRHLIFLAWNPMHMRNLREQHLTMRLWAEKGIVWSMMKSEVVPKYSAKPNTWSFNPQTNFPNPTSKSMRVSICHLGPRSVLPRSISTDELHTFFSHAIHGSYQWLQKGL